MKYQKRITTLLVFALAFIAQAAMAQFQGQIQMNVYSTNDGKPEVNEVNMYVTSERIFLQGEDKMNFGENFQAGGLLIRNDMKDFVVLMGEGEALQITKAEIEGLFDMASMFGGEQEETVKVGGEKIDPTYRYTDETKTIMGYECAQMIIESKDDQGNENYISVWLTPNIDINWGMLGQRWNNLPEEMEATVNGMSRETIFQGKNFPMMVEFYDAKKDRTVKLMEVTSISESSIAKAMVQVPSNVNLLGISELMWKMMMSN